MRAQIEFSSLIIIITVLLCATICILVYARENEANMVAALVKNVAGREAGLRGQKTGLAFVREDLTRWRIILMMRYPSDEVMFKIAEEVSGSLGCDTGFDENGLLLFCPYNTYSVVS